MKSLILILFIHSSIWAINYTVGFQARSQDLHIATLWVTDPHNSSLSKTIFLDQNDSEARSLCNVGQKLYIVGYTKGNDKQACLWVTDLQGSNITKSTYGFSSEATDITYAGGTQQLFYIGGFTVSSESPTAALWSVSVNNLSFNSIPNSSRLDSLASKINSITLFGGSVFCAGFYQNAQSKYGAIFAYTNSKKELSPDWVFYNQQNSEASSITCSQGNFYLCGNYNNQPSLWVWDYSQGSNPLYYPLLFQSSYQSAVANSIEIIGNSFYVAGYAIDNTFEYSRAGIFTGPTQSPQKNSFINQNYYPQSQLNFITGSGNQILGYQFPIYACGTGNADAIYYQCKDSNSLNSPNYIKLNNASPTPVVNVAKSMLVNVQPAVPFALKINSSVSFQK